jgi:histidinol-phosphatase (PHP family)
MSYDSENGFTYIGKDMDRVIEMTEQEIQLIREHKSRVKENNTRDINQNPTQDFCFHTHTQRCGHGAKDTGDEEWVQNAIKGGIKKLAFTDHIPLPDGYNKTPKSRMDIAEVESYITSIRYLQEKYKGQIEIESGFEFEYSDRDLAHLQELKSKTDKMILGQHFVIDADGREYGIARGKGGKQISDEVLEMYGESIISAMDKGLPDVIAHPDLFMRAREEFDDFTRKEARRLCEACKEMGVVIEYNLEGIKTVKRWGKISYPNPEFWMIASEVGNKAIVGIDAHDPESLENDGEFEDAVAMLKSLNIEIVEDIETCYKLQKITKK